MEYPVILSNRQPINIVEKKAGVSIVFIVWFLIQGKPILMGLLYDITESKKKPNWLNKIYGNDIKT